VTTTAAPIGNKTRVRLYGALCVQRGTPMLQAYATADTVKTHARIDTWDPETGEGYQRALVTSRIAQTAEYYDAKRGRMPNPLLVNIREEDFESVSVEVTQGDGGNAGYERAIRDEANWIGAGFIELPQELDVWVYDGQHRNASFVRLLERAFAEYNDFPVPLSLTLGLTSDEEMKEFYEVNSNSKSVKVDLVFELLTKMSESDPEMAELLAVGEKDWIVRGSKVAKVLADLDGPWRGRFQPANTRKRKGDGVVIPMPQFIRSLKPVLDMPLLKRPIPTPSRA